MFHFSHGCFLCAGGTSVPDHVQPDEQADGSQQSPLTLHPGRQRHHGEVRRRGQTTATVRETHLPTEDQHTWVCTIHPLCLSHWHSHWTLSSYHRAPIRFALYCPTAARRIRSWFTLHTHRIFLANSTSLLQCSLPSGKVYLFFSSELPGSLVEPFP